MLESIRTPQAEKRFHLALTIAWALAIPLAVLTGWLYSVAFVSVCSIYANCVGHFSAFQAAKAEENSPDA